MSKREHEDTQEIALDALAAEFPHIPPACGTMMVQAVILCLDKQGHTPGVQLTVSGSCDAVYALDWSDRVTESLQRFWNDWMRPPNRPPTPWPS